MPHRRDTLLAFLDVPGDVSVRKQRVHALLGDDDDAECAADLVFAAGKRSKKYLLAEALHTAAAPLGGDRAERDATQQLASAKFASEYTKIACPTDASESDLASLLDGLSLDAVFLTSVAPGLDDTEFQPVSPVGPIQYEGRELNPRCGFDDDPDYHFFVKRGSVNKLVM